MIPASILHPFYGPHPALISAPAGPQAAVEQPAAGRVPASCPAAKSEHERLAVSADLWRQLAVRLGGMP